MQKRRGGFTLIELLIVIVIIGILAAIAIPKFGKTREKAYIKAMQSDLRNLAAQQEIYYSGTNNNYTYASSVAALEVAPSQGVTIGVTGFTTGWSATAAHQALATTQICAIYAGSAASPHAVAVTPGVIACVE